VAARAAGVPPIGVPVGDSYMKLSGTSMATPHVAGAAALLVQQHPDWTGPQLKAQLIGTANPNPALTAFQQGAGRIDIDRGTRQDVSAEPATLSLGIATFPHDDDPLLVRTVRYHNGGGAPVTLVLAASLHAPGAATPPGMIQVEPAAITVPAGGTSEVTVTVSTSGDLANGLYSGALVASGGDVRVETPIGVDRDPESFDISIDVLDEQGAPAAARVGVFSKNGRPSSLFVEGHTVLHLPRDLYALEAHLESFPFAFLVYPRLDLVANTTITFDGRRARPIAVDVGDPSVQLASTGWQYFDFPLNLVSSTIGFGFSIPAAQIGPDAAPDEVIGAAFATMTDTDIDTAPSLVYNLAHAELGRLPTGWSERVRPDQLATVTARHAGQDDAFYHKDAFPFLPDPVQGLLPFGGALVTFYNGPFERTEKFFSPGFIWEIATFDNRLLPEEPDFPTIVAEEVQLRDYRPGTRITEQWNQATLGPAFPEILGFAGNNFALVSSASRTGDELFIFPSIVASSSTPARDTNTTFDHERIALFRNGTLIEERLDDQPFDPFVVPPEPASYRYEQEIDRSSLFTLSPRITAAWTFRSQHVPGDQPRSLSLPTMRFKPPVDQHNRTAAPVIVLPIAFDRPPGAATPAIRRATVEVSFDDGAHWAPIPVVTLPDRAIAVVIHPARARFVSLRGSAVDALGNKVEQTILRAYALAP
jgi:hypothetical protein